MDRGNKMAMYKPYLGTPALSITSSKISAGLI
jgi:hypothetical protein